MMAYDGTVGGDYDGDHVKGVLDVVHLVDLLDQDPLLTAHHSLLWKHKHCEDIAANNCKYHCTGATQSPSDTFRRLTVVSKTPSLEESVNLA